VETHPVNRYVLQPGEKLNQTRRSIDLAKHEGSRQVPSFVIIGAQKCGTTSLYELLCEHPLVIRGKRRETHFFDWRWLDPLDAAVTAATAAGSTAPAAQEEYRKYFNADALFKYPSLLTGESTPSYLLHSDLVIPRLRAVCPWAKLLVVLRNPVDRAYSQYQMCSDPEGTPEQLKVRGMSAYAGRSFEDIVEEEIAELEGMGINVRHTGHTSLSPRMRRDTDVDAHLTVSSLIFTSPHFDSPHLTSPHLTSPHLTSPHFTFISYHSSSPTPPPSITIPTLPGRLQLRAVSRHAAAVQSSHEARGTLHRCAGPVRAAAAAVAGAVRRRCTDPVRRTVRVAGHGADHRTAERRQQQ
jgi:hypothetical protein